MNLQPSIRLGSSVSGLAFSPASLFASSEPGAWYDPSDLTTMFQDTAGTTPVTATGQTVALLLDKSQGLVLGPELDDGLSNTTNWTVFGTNTIAADGDAVKITFVNNAGGAYSLLQAAKGLSSNLTVGRWYKVTGQAKVNTGSANVAVVTATTATSPAITSTSYVDFTIYFLCDNATTNYIGCSNLSAGEEIWIRGLSVKLLAGNHATQATAASRPIYGIEPFGGRRNLLAGTNDLTNTTNWPNGSIANGTRSGAGVSVTTDEGFAYLVISNANRVNLVSGTSYVFSATVVCDQTITNVPIRFAGGFGANNFQLVSMTAGVPVRISILTTATSSGLAAIEFGIDARNAIVPGGSNATGYVVTFSDPQLETGTTATAYQRVTDQFNVTQAGVASVSYLAFDGTDDFMLTGTITPGIDKAQVFGGVRKLADVNASIAESSSNGTSVNGAFVLQAWDAGRYGTGSRGTSAATAISAVTTYTPPVTNVLTGIGDIAADTCILRANGIQAATSAADQGTGNYLAYPLYIGRRGGTTLPFNGRIYSLIVRFGANLAAGTITQTETWVNGKTGAY